MCTGRGLAGKQTRGLGWATRPGPPTAIWPPPGGLYWARFPVSSFTAEAFTECASCVPGTVLGTRETAQNEAGKNVWGIGWRRRAAKQMD